MSSREWASPRKSRPEDARGPGLRALRGEFLGRTVEILAAPDPTLVGLSGTAVDETLNTLVLRTSDGRTRRVAKAHTTFGLATDQGRVEIQGDRIRYRPEDRIKKVR